MNSKEHKAAQHELARYYRQANVIKAIHRDKGLCTIHWFRDKKSVKFQEVHHVYSRESRYPGSFRESYKSMLCVCRECHPLPIQQPGASANLSWVEDILRCANETPINTSFVHES